jgi:hypothetical protein
MVWLKRFDLRSWILGIFLGNLAGAVYFALFPWGAYNDQINALFPSFWPGNSTTDIITVIAFIDALLVFPAIMSGFAQRYTFLWGFLPPLIASLWTRGIDKGPVDSGMLAIVLVAATLASGPVSAYRYFRSREKVAIKPSRARLFRALWVAIPGAFILAWLFILMEGDLSSRPLSVTPLAKYGSISFVTRVSIASPINDTTWSEVAPAGTYTVTAVQPSSLRIERIGKAPHPLKSPQLSCDLFVSNGNQQLEKTEASRTVLTDPSQHSLEETASSDGMVRLIYPDVLFASSSNPGWYSNGDDVNIDGHHAAVYIRRLDADRTEFMQRLFVARGNNLPVRLSEYRENQAGHLIEVHRADYSSWALNSKPAPSLFDPDPRVQVK